MDLKVYHEEEWQSYPAKTYEEYTYEWAGETHASESIKLDSNGNEVARNPIHGFQGWMGASGSKAEFISGRHVKFPSTGTILEHEIDIPEGATSIHVYFWIRGTEQPEAYDDGRTGLHFTFFQDGTSRIRVAHAPNDGEWHLIEKGFNFQDASKGMLRFNSSGNYSARDVELKEVQVTFDNAPRPVFFDGDTPSDRAWVDFQPRNISGIKRIWPRSEAPPPPGTHYAWLGEPHTSVSVRLDDDGNETARNWVLNPSFEVGTNSITTTANKFTIRTTQSIFRAYSGTRALVVTKTDGVPRQYDYIGHRVSEDVSGWLAWKINDFQAISDDIGAVRMRVDFERNGTTTQIRQGPVIPVSQTVDRPGTDQFVYSLEIPEGTTKYTVYFYTYNDTSRTPSPIGSQYTTDAWHVAVADTEEAALAQVETYFDGDTDSDRAHDLWYNSDGVPHEWVNGQGWVAISDVAN